VRLLTYRKWIVLLALLCQVLTGTLVHVPVASAHADAGAAAMHCPAHVRATNGDSVQGVHAQGHDSSDMNGAHGCKDGHCKCPCAHVPAMAAQFAFPAATVMVYYAFRRQLLRGASES